MCHYVIDTFYLLFFENLYRDFTLIASLVSRMPFFQKLRLSKIAGSSFTSSSFRYLQKFLYQEYYFYSIS